MRYHWVHKDTTSLSLSSTSGTEYRDVRRFVQQQVLSRRKRGELQVHQWTNIYQHSSPAATEKQPLKKEAHDTATVENNQLDSVPAVPKSHSQASLAQRYAQAPTHAYCQEFCS